MTTILKSDRTFGVEIELGFPSQDNIYNLRDRLSGAWNLTRDGSLTCDNPIEIVSPVLSGQKGVVAIKELCEVAKNENGNPDHPSCGMHVHHGAKEFLSQEESDTFTEKSYKTFKNEFKGRVISDMFIEESVIRLIAGNRVGKVPKRDYFRIQDYTLARINTRDEDLSNVYRTTNEQVLAYVDKEKIYVFVIERKLYETLQAQNREAQDSFARRNLWSDVDRLAIDFKKKIWSTRDVDQKGRHVVKFAKDGNFEGLKRLFYFYTMFSPVLQNMVQDSRKIGNMYCIGLRDSFDLEDIYNLKDNAALERLWYKCSSDQDVKSHKRQQRNDSRYHEVNLHSLWYRYGTIEIRSHASTLDWRQIMLWTSFHQHIIEACSTGEITLDQIKEAETLTDVREQTLFMLGLLNLPHNVDKYVRRLVNYFAILKEPI